MPVIEPSGAYITSLLATIQTCGCASAGAAPSAIPAARRKRPSNRCMVAVTSGHLGGFEQAAPAQQRVGLRLAATEGDVGLLRLARGRPRQAVVRRALGTG